MTIDEMANAAPAAPDAVQGVSCSHPLCYAGYFWGYPLYANSPLTRYRCECAGRNANNR